MKKQLLLSVLLCVSGVMSCMQREDNFLSVRVGGYAAKANGQNSTDQYLSKVIRNQGDEWVCNIIVDCDSTSSSVNKENFCTYFEESLKEEKPVIEALGDACQKYELLVDKTKPLELAVSCFDLTSQKMSILLEGNANSVFGGKDSFSAREDESLETLFCKHEYKDDFGYCVDASADFWKSIPKDKIHSLLLAAKNMDTDQFYTIYASRVNREVEVDDAPVAEHEDQDAKNIAKKLVDAALSEQADGNIAVMVTLLGSSEWHFSRSASSSSSGNDDDDETTKSTDDQVIDLVNMAKDLVVPGYESETARSSSSSSVDSQDSESSSSSEELESFDLPQSGKPVITQAYWKVFIQNHKYKIGGFATILAIIVAAYKYNYLHLNYMTA